MGVRERAMRRFWDDLLVARWREFRFRASLRRGRDGALPLSLKMPLLQSLLKLHPQGAEFLAAGSFPVEAVAMVRRLGHPVISLERESAVYESVQRRFQHDRDVVLVHWNSPWQLSDVLNRLDRPALLWLEHGVMPVLAELRDQPIRSHSLLIDHAGSFDGRDSRPDLLAVLTAIRAVNFSYRIKLEGDVLVALAERTASLHCGWRVHFSPRIASPNSTNHQQPSPSRTNG